MFPSNVLMCGNARDSYAEKLAKKGVERTNIVYGSLKPDVEHVMFVNGEIDPWHALGVVEPLNANSPAVLISSEHPVSLSGSVPTFFE